MILITRDKRTCNNEITDKTKVEKKNIIIYTNKHNSIIVL